eukprot:355048-Chlamydomonas_euryale.AAC.3
MPHTYPCPEEGCSISGCKRVVVSSTGDVGLVINHHKSMASLQQMHGGPICPSPPHGSTTHKLTLALVEHVLPMAYADMQGVPESNPLPMLPDLYSGARHLSYRPRFKGMRNYTEAWKDACLGMSSVMVEVGDISDPLDSLHMVPTQFMQGPFMPPDCRRMFVTSTVEHQDSMGQHMMIVTSTVEHQDSMGQHMMQIPVLQKCLKGMAARQCGQ